jgi:hypothetical protein
MTRQHHESSDMQDLIRSLAELVSYCDALEAHAQGAAQALTGQWRGMASSEFMHQVAIWGAGADVLRAGAGDLLTWATAAAASYDSAQSNAGAYWSVS